jgi:glycosyltransferase 2 family protein
MPKGFLSTALRWAQPVFLLIAFGFIIYLLSDQWAELRAYPWQLNPAWFLAACGLLLLAWALEIVTWRGSLRRLDGHLSFGTAIRIWFLSAIVRYIPGNIWQPISFTVLAQRHGVRPEVTLGSIVVYQVVTLLSIVPLTGAYLVYRAGEGLPNLLQSLPPWLIALLIFSPMLIFLLNPAWFVYLLNWMLRKIKRTEIDSTLTRFSLFKLFIIATLDWLLWGAAFAALTFAMGNYSTQAVYQLLPHLVAVYPIALVIGFLSLITPSGLGVREGAVLVLLAPYLPTATVTVIALAMRLWLMAGELLMAAISAVVERRIDNNSSIRLHAPESLGVKPQVNPSVTVK